MAVAVAVARFRRRFRPVACLAISLAAGLGAVFVLRAAAGPRSPGFDSFHTVCATLGLVAVIAGVGTAAWPRIATVAAPGERARSGHPLLGSSLGAFGVIVLAVGLSASSLPAVWAGYHTSTGDVTRVTATWTQPWVGQRGVEPNVVGFWIGLEGHDGNTVEQIGTDGYCDGAVTQYHAWYELYPAPTVPIDLAINPSDTVSATVVSLGRDRFRLTLVNDTTGARFATTQIAKGVGDTAAAIIVEVPQRSGVTLAGFGTVRFTKCAVDGRPLDAFALRRLDIVTDSGVAETTTSELGADGASFSVTRR